MDPRIWEAIALMEKQLHNEASLDDLALSVNLSASRFRHLFKSETSVSPMQYLASLEVPSGVTRQGSRTLLSAPYPRGGSA